MRVLVVEDDPGIAGQLVRALNDAGYTVDQANDGEEGHYLGDTEPYDAVVLDLGLPVLMTTRESLANTRGYAPGPPKQSSFRSPL